MDEASIANFFPALKGLGEESGRRGAGVDQEAVGGLGKEERARSQLHGEIETAHPGYLGAQDTFYVGTLKGVRRIYEQTFLDTYAKVAFTKLYTMKTPLTAAQLLNDQLLAFFEEYAMGLLGVLTDRGTDYCGRHDSHAYELYLAINNIDHSKTKTKHPQTNGICERFHKTVLQEFYQVAFRKKIYRTLDQLQKDLDEWLYHYNHERTHQGKMCCGRTPMQTLLEDKALWRQKVDELNQENEQPIAS